MAWKKQHLLNRCRRLAMAIAMAAANKNIKYRMTVHLSITTYHCRVQSELYGTTVLYTVSA